ncbi:MAG: DUF817 domain-containing protein [Pseudomonadota bacterium]
MNRRFTSVEARIDRAAHLVLDRLPANGIAGAAVEFLVFGIKQAWACIFGGLLLALMIGTRLYWPEAAPIHRSDFLFLAALSIQACLLLFKLETWDEAKVILAFHIVGTAMELFKTAVGSWTYPEDAIFRIATVPLFSGFMYAAVGSYIARITRIFDMRYTGFPPLWAVTLLAVAIYVNFFAHHYVIDIRMALFAITAILFFRTWVHYRVFRWRLKMPLLVGFSLVTLFIWIAENIATWSNAWLYPTQANGWVPVSASKLGAWFLLMIISFVLVKLVHRPRGLDPSEDHETQRSHPTPHRPYQQMK